MKKSLIFFLLLMACGTGNVVAAEEGKKSEAKPMVPTGESATMKPPQGDPSPKAARNSSSSRNAGMVEQDSGPHAPRPPRNAHPTHPAN